MDRNVESNLRSAQRHIWQFVFHHATQYVLGLRTAQFEVRRQPPGEIDNPWIEKWRPHLERMSHTDPVHFVKDVVRQVVTLVEIEIALQLWSARHFQDQFRERARICKRKKSLLLSFRKRSIPKQVCKLR